MSEVSFIANESNMRGVDTELYRMADVTDDMWRELQVVHIESLQAQLPKADWYRADEIARTGDVETYRDRRVRPNNQAGQDGRKKNKYLQSHE